MASLANIQAKFEALKGKEINFVGEAINENAVAAIILNRDQLSEDTKVDGTKSGYVYAKETIFIKSGKEGLSGVTDHLTNYDTGESYQQLFAKVDENKIIFGTSSGLENEIDNRMDGMAFGLNPGNKEEFLKQYVNPLFIQKIKDFLSL